MQQLTWKKILNWPAIKAEDMLQSFSLFLRGCPNLTQWTVHMQELDMTTNLRNIVMKLSYKLREKWGNGAFDLQEQRGSRAVFTDLLIFF